MRLPLRMLPLAIAVLLAAAPANAGAHVPPLWNMAYGTVTRGDGTWAYGASTGLTPHVVLPAIESSGAVFVRAGLSRPPTASTAGYYDQLHSEDPDLRLGVRLEVGSTTLQETLAKARSLRDSPSGCQPAPGTPTCYFDWLYLDSVHKLNTTQIQRLMDRLQASGPTDGGGWQLIVANETGASSTSRIARGLWAHAHSLNLLGTRAWRAGKKHLIEVLRDPHRSVLTHDDRQFIKLVHHRDPGSWPVLKFEIHTETDRLQTLSSKLQRRLIRRLSQEQLQHRFRMIYPLFVSRSHGPHRPECDTGCRIYNSLGGDRFSAAAAGQATYATQAHLMLNSPFGP